MERDAKRPPKEVSKQRRQTIQWMVCWNEFAIPGGRASAAQSQPNDLTAQSRPDNLKKPHSRYSKTSINLSSAV